MHYVYISHYIVTESSPGFDILVYLDIIHFTCTNVK
jgi:hypothetical protein